MLPLDDEFMALQQSFMDEHYHYFEDVEENKLIYTDIQKKYVHEYNPISFNIM